MRKRGRREEGEKSKGNRCEGEDFQRGEEKDIRED